MIDKLQHVSDMIVDGLVTDLTAEFAKDEVHPSEDVSVLRGGRLQDNPVKAGLSIMVHIGDPDDPTGWKDGSMARRDDALDRQMYSAAAFEMPYGSAWWRRGVVEFQWFGIKTKQDRDEARRVALLTMGRIERAIAQSTNAVGMKDSLGETVLKILPVASRASEGGGPPNQFIWRGKVYWQAHTERDF